ncbi:MAG: hypothetical protein H7844_09275 [Nitrospirae bacterium YQR-1]
MVDVNKFTNEESRIYEDAITTLKGYVDSGMGYEEAVNKLTVSDAQLKQIISDDFLKILIVEMHYEGAMAVKDVASKLGVTVELIVATKNEMLEEVQSTAIKAFHNEARWGNA